MSTVTRVRVPAYVDTPGGATLYPIEVMSLDGKIRKVSKRYSDVLKFHETILRTSPHPLIERFNFPHKSMFNTSAEYTKERRRSGFEEYFELLLRLPEYKPFLATFLLKTDNDAAAGAASSREEDSVHYAKNEEEIEEDRLLPFDLKRPSTAVHWFGYFYVPVACAAFVYAQLLTLLGGIRKGDWNNGSVWLAVFTCPLVLTIALAFIAPIAVRV